MTTKPDTYTPTVQDVIANRFGPHYMYDALTKDFDTPRKQAVSGQGGNSNLKGPGWFGTTGTGIYYSPGAMSPTAEGALFLTWAQVHRVIRGFQPDRVDFFIRVHRESENHRRTFKPFHASKLAQGCGPLPPDEKDWTDKHRAYVTESREYDEKVHGPWRAKYQTLRALEAEAFAGLFLDGLTLPEEKVESVA